MPLEEVAVDSPDPDRECFILTADAAAEWDALDARPARDLPVLRELLDRPTPFAD